MPRLLLASRSPRRRQILAGLGVDFEVVSPPADELRDGDPERLVLENARRKARAGLAAAGRPGLPVLGVDTDVVVDGRALGKPADEAEARRCLEALSGRTHEVLSGVAVLTIAEGGGEPAERSGVARSAVTFARLDPETIRRYLDSGEWRDRAGGYAVQGLGSTLVDRLEGDLSNVIGLPIRLLLRVVPELIA